MQDSNSIRLWVRGFNRGGIKGIIPIDIKE